MLGAGAFSFYQRTEEEEDGYGVQRLRWVPSPSNFFKKKISIFIGLCTGAGEYIVRANLARSIADALNRASATDADEDVDVHEVLQRVLAEEFWSIILLTSLLNENLQLSSSPQPESLEP